MNKNIEKFMSLMSVVMMAWVFVGFIFYRDIVDGKTIVTVEQLLDIWLYNLAIILVAGVSLFYATTKWK